MDLRLLRKQWTKDEVFAKCNRVIFVKPYYQLGHPGSLVCCLGVRLFMVQFTTYKIPAHLSFATGLLAASNETLNDLYLALDRLMSFQYYLTCTPELFTVILTSEMAYETVQSLCSFLFRILTSSLQMTNTIQKRFKVSSTQLLYQSCPYQALTLFVIGPFLDGLLTNLNVFAFNYTPQVLVFIVLSCLISVSVNFSTFLVIGKTSPVTYQVLGHLKTCLVLGFGYCLLHDPFSWRNIFGIVVALVGMVMYSYFCTVDSQQKAAESSALLSQVKEIESDPLLGVENGTGVVSDSVAAKTAVWSSNKDLHA